MTATVDEVAGLIKDGLNALGNFKAHGEIGRVTKASSGHTYFDIKSSSATLSCIAWSSYGLTVVPGPAEISVKKIDFYAPSGKASVIVDRIQALQDAEAEISAKRTNLIQTLREEKILDRSRFAIPTIVDHLCIITSIGSAACHDMQEGISARWPGMYATVIDSLVQGDNAPKSLSNAFKKAISLDPLPSVIICGRGGGSESDLQAFNEESTVRAFLSAVHLQIPVISAVGHENDHSITDQVADHRAKTPTAAIEIAIPSTKAHLLEQLHLLRSQLARNMKIVMERETHNCERLMKTHVDTFALRLKYHYDDTKRLAALLTNTYQSQLLEKQKALAEFKNTLTIIPKLRIDAFGQRLSLQKKDIHGQVLRLFRQFEFQIEHLSCRLEGFSHQHTLKRGFALIDGVVGPSLTTKRIKSVYDMERVEELRIRLHDGTLFCRNFSKEFNQV